MHDINNTYFAIISTNSFNSDRSLYIILVGKPQPLNLRLRLQARRNIWIKEHSRAKLLYASLDEVIGKRPTASEFIDRLNDAIIRLLPYEYAVSYASGQKLSFVKIEDLKNKMDKNRERDIKLVMPQHLFAHPLYEHCRRTVLRGVRRR